jgi:branched-subunit amino acid aminotransferase/4-amino-4-deoxychorismate lyase
MSTHTPFSALLWDGHAFAPAESVPLTDRGFRYGVSLFESFPVRAGSALFLDEHIASLRHACAVAGLAIPRGALEACGGALRHAPDGFGRIHLTGGDGTVTEAFDHCRVLLSVESREGVPARVYHRGYDLGIHAAGYVPVFPGLKTGNYWPNLLAFREGVAQQRNETLLFSPAGHLVSACMANVFLVVGGKLTTPALATGARPGIVRKWVLERTHAEETLLNRAEVERATDIFLTSSWLGIMPVASLEGRPLTDRAVSASLLVQYRTLT